jgi:hypothetical protein
MCRRDSATIEHSPRHAGPLIVDARMERFKGQ